MTIRKLIQTAAFAAAFCTAGSAFAGVNLIVNGSFEADAQAPGTEGIYANLTGWTGGDYGIELRNALYGNAADGSNYVELDTTHNSLMFQKIDTVPGQTYTLTFAYSPRMNVAKDSNGIKVFWNGDEVATEKAKGAKNGNDWTTYTITVVGGLKDKSKLEFKAIGADDGVGGGLDAISLTSAVPEPAAYSMIMIGVGLVGLASRRKQKNPKFQA